MEDIPQQDDGFQWFGEGFGGFPKRLPEDCVEYAIYVVDDDEDGNHGTKPDDDNVAIRTRTRLDHIHSVAKTLVQKHLQDYIWQRDVFELKLQADGRHPHLRGRTNFGDSISDEWVIVWLLHALSKTCPHAWVRMHDTDGEFLLIEAASALPTWLNPDIAQHRVWLHWGHLRLIPLQRRKSHQPSPRNLSLEDALKFIATAPQEFLISPTVQDAAFARLKDYPAAIALSLHHALLPIPRQLAHLLHLLPASIAPAVEAFYLRDPASLRPLMAAKSTITTAINYSTDEGKISNDSAGPLHFSPVDFVTTSVRFTKVLYAQLHSQPFSPPPAWMQVLPLSNDNTEAPSIASSQLDHAKWEMGMKLTCGFEMLVRDPLYADKSSVRHAKSLLDELESGGKVLPTDDEIAGWSQRQDGEEWLDIDFDDFEAELANKKGGQDARSTRDTAVPTPTSGNEDDEPIEGATKEHQTAKESLRKMVRRFEDFLDDDEDAGMDEDGLDDDDDSDESEVGDGVDESAGLVPTTDASFKPSKGTVPRHDRPSPAEAKTEAPTMAQRSAETEADFQQSIKVTRSLPASALESSGLLAEARRLALEDAEQGSPVDEDDEMRQVMALMEKELKGHGALNLKPETGAKSSGASRAKGDSKGKNGNRSQQSTPNKSTNSAAERTVFFGPERPPHMPSPQSPITPPPSLFEDDDDDDDVGPGDLELSSDEEEDNDVDLNLARNLLESFKGQAGLQGPAGNMMKALGVGLPRDEG